MVDPTTDRDTLREARSCSRGSSPTCCSRSRRRYTRRPGLLTPFPASWINANFILPNNIKGQDYIPPTNSQIIPLVFYNKALFAKAGRHTPPTTWAQFMADCAAAEGGTASSRSSSAAHDSFAAAMPLTGALSADVLGANPNWIQQRYAGTVKFSDANVVAAATKMRTLVTDGYFEPDALSVSYADSITNFNAGQGRHVPDGQLVPRLDPEEPVEQHRRVPVADQRRLAGHPVLAAAARWRSARRRPDQAAAFKFAESWSLNPDNLQVAHLRRRRLPDAQGQAAGRATASPLSPAFNYSFSYVTNPNTKVSSMSWATNDDALPGNVTNDFDAAAQALFSTLERARPDAAARPGLDHAPPPPRARQSATLTVEARWGDASDGVRPQPADSRTDRSNCASRLATLDTGLAPSPRWPWRCTWSS